MALSILSFSTRLHSICTPGSPTTSASPFAPQYCWPRLVSNPYSRNTAASSRSPAAPLLLLFIHPPSDSLSVFFRCINLLQHRSRVCHSLSPCVSAPPFRCAELYPPGIFYNYPDMQDVSLRTLCTLSCPRSCFSEIFNVLNYRPQLFQYSALHGSSETLCNLLGLFF